jgi:endonuclease YncB( thermonuclease family)
MLKVTNVLDGDTFKITPNWKWGDKTGDTVRAAGYDTPEEGEAGYEAARIKLKNLIQGEEVELKNPIKLTYGRLLCDVFFKGKNLKDYFPEYQ